MQVLNLFLALLLSSFGASNLSGANNDEDGTNKLTEAFNKFLSRETLCNVTLSVNRRSIKAHQVQVSL